MFLFFFIAYHNVFCFVFSEATGNFPTVTRMLLAKIPSVDGMMTYVYGEFFSVRLDILLANFLSMLSM